MKMEQPGFHDQPCTVRICQHRSCRKLGSALVLTAFQQKAPGTIAIETSECFGQCGNGPMVLVLPEQIWYCHVLPEEVSAIVTRHLIHGQPIAAMLYPKFHPKS
jgi:(2Fe-2S) ferredoxin